MNANDKGKAQESDVTFPNPPSDSISSISINGTTQKQTNMLISTSWDNTVNCYEIQSNQGKITNIIAQSQIKHDAPVLCSDINSTDQVTVFSGGCDNTVRMWNVTQGPSGASIIGRHDSSVRCIKHLPDKNVVVTGSWDKTLKVWDMRQPNAVAAWTLSERCYTMDAAGQVLVASTADKQIHVFDLTAGTKVADFKSPLSYQTRCLSIFHDMKGRFVHS